MTTSTDIARQQVERVRRAMGSTWPFRLQQAEPRPARVLLLDDDPIDLRALKRSLSRLESGVITFDTSTVRQALHASNSAYFDVAVLDYDLSDGNSLEVLRVMAAARVPVIVVTGAGNERLAAMLLGEGAAGYLIKDVAGTYLDVLPEKVKRAMERAQLEIERDTLLDKMAEMLETINALKGLIPVCSVCRKIRDANGDWENFEVLVSKTYTAEFTHGLCPNCFEAQMREFGLD